MTTVPAPVVRRRPSPLDWLFAASLALAGVAVAGLPAVVDDFGAPDSAGAAALVVGILGALGLAGCWIAAALRRGRIALGLPLLAAGVLFWFLQTVASEAIGWRLAVGVFGMLAAGLTTLGWLTMRRYAPLPFATLPLLLVGSVIVALAPTHGVQIAGLLVASLLPIVGANVVQRFAPAG